MLPGRLSGGVRGDGGGRADAGPRRAHRDDRVHRRGDPAGPARARDLSQTELPGAGGAPPAAPPRRHWTILPSRITNEVLATPPTPGPHTPGPGRSVSLNVAVVNEPAESARTRRAPQGSDSLKRRASSKLRMCVRTGPFSAVLGIAKHLEAASTFPWRSALTQPSITCTSAALALPATVEVVLLDELPPPHAARTSDASTRRAPTARARIRSVWPPAAFGQGGDGGSTLGVQLADQVGRRKLLSQLVRLPGPQVQHVGVAGLPRLRPDRRGHVMDRRIGGRCLVGVLGQEPVDDAAGAAPGERPGERRAARPCERLPVDLGGAGLGAAHEGCPELGRRGARAQDGGDPSSV